MINLARSQQKTPLLKPSERNGGKPKAISRQRNVSRYEILKDKIRTWWNDRVVIGQSLVEIRDSKLYKDEYGTFDEFCDAEYGFTPRHAYRLIEFAEIKADPDLRPIGHKITNEAQARALAAVPKEKRVEVLTEAAQAPGPVTAKKITEAAKSNGHAKDSSPAEVDKLGRPIPADLVSEWKRAEQVGKKLQSLAREIKSTVSEGFAGAKQDKLNDVIYAEVGNSIITEAAALGYALGSIIPYALCPTCQGRNRKTCALCRKRGWISKFLWNSPAVSEETRKLIQGRLS